MLAEPVAQQVGDALPGPCRTGDAIDVVICFRSAWHDRPTRNAETNITDQVNSIGR